MVLNEDTLVVITPEQLRYINLKLEYKNMLVRENFYWSMKFHTLDSINKAKERNFMELIKNYENRNDELINTAHLLSIENSKLQSSQKRKNKRFWSTLTASVVVGLVLGILIAK